MAINKVRDKGAFPRGTSITIEDIEDEDTIEAISSAVEGNVSRLHAVDITFRDAEQHEIEPLIPIQVTMTELRPWETSESSEKAEEWDDIASTAKIDVGSNDIARYAKTDDNCTDFAEEWTESVKISEETADPTSNNRLTGNEDGTDRNGKIPADTYNITKTTEQEAAATARNEKPVVVHLQDDGETQLMDTSASQNSQEAQPEVAFEASSFSIYALVYTVDFSYAVNGMTYEFSIPGGGFVSLSDLVEILGIINANGTDNVTEDSEDENVNEEAKEEANNVNEEANEEAIEVECAPERTSSDAADTTDTTDAADAADAAIQFVSDVENVTFSNGDLLMDMCFSIKQSELR